MIERDGLTKAGIDGATASLSVAGMKEMVRWWTRTPTISTPGFICGSLSLPRGCAHIYVCCESCACCICISLAFREVYLVLFAFLSLCMCLSHCVCRYLCVSLGVCLALCVCMCLSVCMCCYVSARVCASLSICVCMSVFLSVCVSL